MLKLEELLGDRYADFEALNSVEKTSCVLGVSFGSRISEFIVDVWEVNCMAMTHALINFSLSPHLGIWGVPLGLRCKGMVSSGKVSCIVCYACRVCV